MILSYVRTPTLLNSENTIVFSEKSDTSIFGLKEFLKDLNTMYNNIKIEQVVEHTSCDSEFGLKLASNGLGQILIDIVYNAWGSNGNLKFEHKIDQSCLPKIISDPKIILAKYE